MAISAEKLNIILAARDKEFTKAMERSQRRVEMFAKKSQGGLSKTSKSFDDLAGVARKLAPALAAAFSVKAFDNALKGAVEIDNLSKIAGVASDRFQVLALTSSQFGISQEKLSDILKDVNDKFGDYMQTGAGPLADFFENIAPKVGLTASAFESLSSDAKLGAYVNALQEANVSQADMTFYMEAIASDSTALVRAFENNSAAIKEMEQKAAQLGLVIDRETIEKSKEAKQELDLMAKVMDVQVTQALLAIAPLAVQAAGAIATITSEVSSFLTMGQRLAALSQVELLDADGLRDLANEYSGLGKELSKVGQAQAAYNENVRRYGANSDQALTFARDLAKAESELANAIAKKQAQAAAEESATSGVNNLRSEVEVLKEKARLQSMTAQAAERERIESQRLAYENSILNDLYASGKDVTVEQYDAVFELGKAWEEAAINASKILNPIEKAKAATKAAKEETLSAAEQYDLLMKKMIDASPALQSLGFDAEKLGSVMQTVEGSMESAFMSMIDGTASAKDAFKSMAAQIIKELYRVLVVQQIVGAITGAITGGSSLAPSTSLRPQLRPAASGRPVSAGDAYMTGEHGRELFVPKVDGRILSAAQTNNMQRGGGDGGVTVIQNNNFQSGVTRGEVSALLPKMVEASKAAVLDAKRQGGSYGKAFS